MLHYKISALCLALAAVTELNAMERSLIATNAQASTKSQAPNYSVALHTGAMVGAVRYLKQALKTTSIDHLDAAQKTALYYAAWFNHVEATRYLCELGANAKIVKEDQAIASRLNQPERAAVRAILNDAIVLEPVQVRRQIMAAYNGVKHARKGVQQEATPDQKANDELWNEQYVYLAELHLPSARRLIDLLAQLKQNGMSSGERDKIASQALELTLQLGSRPWINRFFKNNEQTHLKHVCSWITLLVGYSKLILFATDKLGGTTLHRAVTQGMPCAVVQLLKRGRYSGYYYA